MALIKCTECENQISDKAVACPKCGAPMEKEKPVVPEVSNRPIPSTANSIPAYNSQVLKSHNKKTAAIIIFVAICLIATIVILVASGIGSSSGGGNGNKRAYSCPKCYSTNVHAGQHNTNTGIQNFWCNSCGYTWTDFDNGLRQGGYR